ncbi:hypothetical protein [Chryseobacterium arthrosphaerae]|uniref:hypothetical protein n=1 Tax=Chryseobacterium arthrosphaerae TaxID=651561 RepID=UPI001E611F77|nr:hypothetical protein [Chryseobacterium arthrosphaerae]UEQ75801.1 hypothetical protein J8N07_19460 [Chryseobacterium arthrosphaerae]
MKKEHKCEKKLLLKKVQLIKLNLIIGGDGNVTNGDTTTSVNCPKPTKPIKPTEPTEPITDNGGN